MHDPIMQREGHETAVPGAARRERVRLWPRLALSFAVLVFLLLAGELFFRFVMPPPGADRFDQHSFVVGGLGFQALNEIMRPDPELFWKVAPGLQDRYLAGWVGPEDFLSFPVSTDARGLRVMPGPASGPNLLFLGDSCTFGLGIKAEETYAARAAEALHLRARNLSCPGYTLYQGRRLLGRLGWGAPPPEALVVSFGFNDLLRWDGLTDREHGELFARRQGFLARHSRLYLAALLAFEGGLRALRPDARTAVPRVPPEEFRAGAEALLEEARRRGVPVVFLFWPRSDWIPVPGKGHPYAALLRELADGRHAAVLDLTGPVREQGGARLFLDGIHGTPECHALAARLLLETLEGMGVSRGD